MPTPFGVLRQPYVASGGNPGPGQRVGIVDEQVGRRLAARSLIEVGLYAQVNLGVVKGDVAVSAATPRAGAEAKPAIIGKGSGQVANREDRRYSGTHDYNLSRRYRMLSAHRGAILPRVA